MKINTKLVSPENRPVSQEKQSIFLKTIHTLSLSLIMLGKMEEDELLRNTFFYWPMEHKARNTLP